MKIDFEIKIDDVLKDAMDKVKKRIQKDLQSSIKVLGRGGLKEAQKLASEKLSGNLGDMYKEGLYMEQISENMVVIGIRPNVKFLEHGQKGGFMEFLLKSAKVSKSGIRYKVIPFRQETAKRNMPEGEQKDMVGELKSFLRSKGQPYSKTRNLAVDANGSPRIGKINSWDIKDMRGKGKKSAKELSPNLQGVSVYQNFNKKSGKVERNIMTFRVITDKHRGLKWMRKATSGVKILDEVHKWIQSTWRSEILPSLKTKYEGK